MVVLLVFSLAVLMATVREVSISSFGTENLTFHFLLALECVEPLLEVLVFLDEV